MRSTNYVGRAESKPHLLGTACYESVDIEAMPFHRFFAEVDLETYEYWGYYIYVQNV